MKTSFLKKGGFSIAVAILGIGGAFLTTSASKTTAATDIQGYRFLSSNNVCQEVKLCSTIEGPVCKSGTTQLWGKEDDSQTHPCEVMLYERQ